MDDLPPNNLMRAVTGFEQSRTPEDLIRVGGELADWLGSPEREDLKGAFTAWLNHLGANMEPGMGDWSPGGTLEEATMTLAERVAQWPEQWRKEGVAEGIAEGIREGVTQERDLLRRLARVRFGGAVAGRVEHLLRETEDWGQLATVAELIVRADTGADLVDGVVDVIGAGASGKTTT